MAGYRPPAELKTGIKHKPPHVGRKTNVRGLFCIPVIKEHHDLLVFGQTQRFCQLVRVKKVDPAAVHACIGSAQQQVGGHDGGILHAGVHPFAGVSKGVVLVIGDHQTNGGTVAAGSGSIDLCQPLFGLNDVDALFLGVLGGGCQPTGFQNGVECCSVYLACTKIFAGIPLCNKLSEFHNDLLLTWIGRNRAPLAGALLC